jgi:hypothetical protein
MAHVDWKIKGREYANCNCAYGCPCQFNALPTYGDCRAVVGYQIDEGHFGETRLDGLRAALVVSWPGPIHHGDGVMQAIIDERADDAQREALTQILHGEETEPGATMWAVFATTMSKVHDPIYSEIKLDVDVDARRASFVVPGLIESKGEPIKNPVSGDEHRARIDLPHGFEYAIAEIGSGTSKSTGAIPMELTDSYGQFAELHLSTNGVVR